MVRKKYDFCVSLCFYMLIFSVTWRNPASVCFPPRFLPCTDQIKLERNQGKEMEEHDIIIGGYNLKIRETSLDFELYHRLLSFLFHCSRSTERPCLESRTSAPRLTNIINTRSHRLLINIPPMATATPRAATAAVPAAAFFALRCSASSAASMHDRCNSAAALLSGLLRRIASHRRLHF